MENTLREYYHCTTKVVDAVRNRRAQSVLVPQTDRLQLVYDLYEFTHRDPVKPLVNLIFLHGSGMNRVVWEYYLVKLAHNAGELPWQPLKIVLLDQATHGDSAVLNEGKLGVDFDWVDGARDACQIALDEFPLELDGETVHNVVVGHSMGGFQALCCAVLCLDFFSTVIAIEPVVVAHFMPEDHRQFTVLNSKFFNALWAKMESSFETDAEYVEFMTQRSFFTKTHPVILQRLIDFERRMDHRDGTVRTKIDRRQNSLCYMTLNPCTSWLIANLKFIHVPVYSIVGGVSHWTPPANQELLTKEIHNYEKHIVEDGDHLLNLEMPDAVLMEIQKHISKFVSTLQDVQVEKLSDSQRTGRFAEQYRRFCKERISDFPLSKVAKL
ncbi:triglyceride lipase KNAG_0L02060 [Huiozyma naganishii CBS 8797]|uniref:AB hydrolase-1 domain-containing protein n=1 Tax=Huiozyma naganishii (strain ATCC MYA-139 / BCRC 22969 / CBS 8797 / KCTC 17520 / NBRC 10181 / NCYC 3082 / Yp74L-3) TaxID=1071383 RepID=J7SAK4_HUIN7|nr:hypothetical protein KNAG_0L02060 [Kazachstania naganishii CBS 8797]CCK72824.1 hypothetical protein KNAG_0L02060 [Kazachstania naganishii CBS 8797]